MSYSIQQQPWQSNPKRQVLGDLQDNNASDFDGSNMEHVNAMFEDLDDKFENLCTILKAEMEQYNYEQEEMIATELVKLPKAIKQMTVRDFNELHGCDLLAILKSKDGVIPTKNANLIPMKRNFNAVMTTPAIRPRNPATITSAMRTARKGEVM